MKQSNIENKSNKSKNTPNTVIKIDQDKVTKKEEYSQKTIEQKRSKLKKNEFLRN